MAQPERSVGVRHQTESLPTLVGELWELVLAYAKQQTVDPIKATGRFVAVGVASSVVFDDNRISRNFLNLTLSTGPNFFSTGRGGLSLNVENLFDHNTVINFNSGFSGTRFQQGRRVVVSGYKRF